MKKNKEDYECFDLVGINYIDDPELYEGEFEGYAVAEEDNEHDKYAVSVYNKDNVRLGYIPRGNKKVHEYILNNGGVINAYGGIESEFDADNEVYYWGDVCLEIKK